MKASFFLFLCLCSCIQMLPTDEPNVLTVHSDDCEYEIFFKSATHQYIDQSDCEMNIDNTVRFENAAPDTLTYRATNYSKTLRGKIFHAGKKTHLELKFN